MGRDNNIYRTYILVVLSLIFASFLITIFSGACVHWLATAAGIVVLYHMVRSADR